MPADALARPSAAHDPVTTAISGSVGLTAGADLFAHELTVVIPVLNQLHYTQQCLATLLASGVAAEDVLIIDNGSSDGTGRWLEQEAGVPHLRNPVNLGCAGAWTQGALARPARWMLFLNNDVRVGHGLVEALIRVARDKRLDIVSPAMVEGFDDYEVERFQRDFVGRMGDVLRPGYCHGVCFLVPGDLFHRIGFFDTDRTLGGGEDTEFELRCKRAGGQVAITGAAMLHHYAGITQAAIKRETGQRHLGVRGRIFEKLGMGWLARKRYQLGKKRDLAAFSRKEEAQHRLSLHMIRQDGAWSLR